MEQRRRRKEKEKEKRSRFSMLTLEEALEIFSSFVFFFAREKTSDESSQGIFSFLFRSTWIQKNKDSNTGKEERKKRSIEFFFQC